MVIRLGEYEGKDRDGNKVSRNYVRAVGPKTEETYLPEAKPKAQSARAGTSQKRDNSVYDDEIPF